MYTCIDTCSCRCLLSSLTLFCCSTALLNNRNPEYQRHVAHVLLCCFCIAKHALLLQFVMICAGSVGVCSKGHSEVCLVLCSSGQIDNSLIVWVNMRLFFRISGSFCLYKTLAQAFNIYWSLCWLVTLIVVADGCMDVIDAHMIQCNWCVDQVSQPVIFPYKYARKLCQSVMLYCCNKTCFIFIAIILNWPMSGVKGLQQTSSCAVVSTTRERRTEVNW